jgi:hypothetical protein
MILVLPTHVLEQAMIQTSKIHNMFIQNPNNTYFCGDPLENGDKIHGEVCQ